jgi:ubiquinone/menaquinone biosynthesis C-methylase UbiE
MREDKPQEEDCLERIFALTSEFMSEESAPALDEPFRVGRDAARLLFDFAVMLSMFADHRNTRVLDFACGTGWISEFLCRAGFDVTGVDIDANAESVFSERLKADQRIDLKRFRFRHADGHHLPFDNGVFGHLVCFDALHHMADYRKAFCEIFRVLDKQGRAIFVEPGAKHSRSKETQEFIEQYKKEDPTWLEKDVILEDISVLAKEVGFKDARIFPHMLPNLKNYRLDDWIYFVKQKQVWSPLGTDYLQQLANLNYDERIIFYLQK